jgi:BetI-type transcriptional repressor, C-terminal
MLVALHEAGIDPRASGFKPGMAALLGAIENYLTVAPRTRKHTTTLQAVIAESLTEPALRPAVAQVNRRSLDRLAAMIRIGTENGEIRGDIDPEREAIILLGALRSLMAIWLIDPRDAHIEMREGFAACVRKVFSV